MDDKVVSHPRFTAANNWRDRATAIFWCSRCKCETFCMSKEPGHHFPWLRCSNCGQIAGAGVPVGMDEPPGTMQPLIDQDNKERGA